MSRTLLITGASSDVGIELIRNIASNYERIVAHYYHWSEKLDSLKQDLGERIIFLQADFSDKDSVQHMISTIKQYNLEPDHIVHFPIPKIMTQKFSKTDWYSFENGWEMSIHSLVTILQSFLPHMHKKKYGKIVLMLTSYTLNLPPKFQTAYITVKYALLGLMKSLASEYADKGITFNGVSPDMIQTKFLSELPDLLIEQYAMNRPLHRILTVKDVVPTFVFLLSDGADHINGVNIGIQ